MERGEWEGKGQGTDRQSVVWVGGLVGGWEAREGSVILLRAQVKGIEVKVPHEDRALHKVEQNLQLGCLRGYMSTFEICAYGGRWECRRGWEGEGWEGGGVVARGIVCQESEHWSHLLFLTDTPVYGVPTSEPLLKHCRDMGGYSDFPAISLGQPVTPALFLHRRQREWES